ncbi:MAG: CinA family protein, partial [Clostridiales bacterium]|nr:CinA family protein [Clostridiales bacterium]
PGASKVFLGGITAYTNTAKMALARVPKDILDAFGAVSSEAAEALAKGVREALDADIAVGITGVAGPGPDDKGNPEGRVFIALWAPDRVSVRSHDFFYNRERIRLAAASSALDLIRRYLTGLPLK